LSALIVGQAYTQATAFAASGGNGSYTSTATTVAQRA